MNSVGKVTQLGFHEDYWVLIHGRVIPYKAKSLKSISEAEYLVGTVIES